MAVLCVKDHDSHHRPEVYEAAQHLELGTDAIAAHKKSWESFVRKASEPNPQVAATISAFGTAEHLHAVQLVLQWSDEKIEHTRVWHLLDGSVERWADEIINEVQSIGSTVPIVLVNEPQDVRLCPCCGKGLSSTIKEGFLLRSIDQRWHTQSYMSIYINPSQPSLAMTVSLRDKEVYQGSLHLCRGTHLHYKGSYFEERKPVLTRISVRTQATGILEKTIERWQPAYTFIGTGNPDKPSLIDRLVLPKCWERGSYKT